ncbi:metallophosphoesterase [Caproiciproducens sp. NJN-50]|uniref:metallophosphoesterase n=1 Tax=Acutalibacteraceae TaxID=3082771 RepID=UPI000FFE066E|nr:MULTISPECIES: metallophosphoesterase [Acutalibacteraceae]QAT50303.1 metallophosphoesterase [Caproiciproducens sp. NJN-50]
MKNNKRNKHIIWAFRLAALAACSIWLYRGNTSIQTTQVRISSERIPVSFDGFVIVHVSDLHNAEFGNNQDGLLEAVKDAAPNLIAITGDLIDSRHTNITKAMEFINGAVTIAPVYYVTGNHESRISEYPQIEKQMAEAGVIILRNQGTALKRKGNGIRLLGLDDPDFIRRGNPANPLSTADAMLKNLLNNNSSYTVLLSHRPELFDIYSANDIDLVLSGHAHGGQVRVPFIGGLVAPNQGVFPKYYEGVYEKGRTKMVVSRGLGNSIAPVRINNRPELVVITLSS